MGCEYLDFSKDRLKEQDKVGLKDLTNFEILLTIMKNKDASIKQMKICLELVLTLLLPDYKISFLPSSIMFSKKIENNQVEQKILDKENFENFRDIVSTMFCLNEIKGKNARNKYNPKGTQAEALVKKFIEREQKLAKLKNKDKKKDIAILQQYVSILAVGLGKDKNQLMEYTVYQLFDQIQRFRMKQSFDMYVNFKMAGAKDIEDVENWMGDIHPDKKD